MGCLRLYVADRWWGQAIYLSWWLSLTKDMQTKRELIHMNEKFNRYLILLSELVNFYQYISGIWSMPQKMKQHHFIGVAKQFILVNSADSVLSDSAVCTVNVADSDATQPTAS